MEYTNYDCQCSVEFYRNQNHTMAGLSECEYIGWIYRCVVLFRWSNNVLTQGWLHKSIHIDSVQ